MAAVRCTFNSAYRSRVLRDNYLPHRVGTVGFWVSCELLGLEGRRGYYSRVPSNYAFVLNQKRALSLGVFLT
jgi:hypothetical protein